MFHTTDGCLTLAARRLPLAVLLALSLAIPPFSTQCSLADEKTTPKTETPKEAKSERQPFDLTYLPPYAMGVIAIRPSAIFNDPSLKPLAAVANEGLAELCQSLKLTGGLKLFIEDIEGIIGFIMIVPGDKRQGRDHSLKFVLSMIRVKHEFNWVKWMRQLDPKTEEVRHGDRICYHVHSSAMLAGASPKGTMCLFMPDDRSLVFLYQKKTESALLKGQSIQRPQFPWDEDWKRVEHGRFAGAIDNRWAKGLSKEQIDSDPEWASIVQNTASIAAGVDWKDGIDFQAYLRGKDRTACDQIEKDLQAELTQLRRECVQPLEDVPEDERQVDAFEAQWSKDLVEHARIERCESTVRVRTVAKINLAEFVKLCIGNVTSERK